MKRIFHPYEKWEDWKDGLYLPKLTNPDEAIIIRSARLLSTPELLLWTMRRVAAEWVCSCEVNLSNRSRNRQAWLGQSACCLLCGASEDMTKAAWHRISAAEKIAANAVADTVIQEWEGRYAQEKTRRKCA